MESNRQVANKPFLILSYLISHESDCIHLVLDSYIEMSLKEGERMRRIDPTTGINIVGMTRDTPIPQQLDKFWSSQENKQNLQLLVRDTVSGLKIASDWSPWATKNRPGRLEIMIQEPIGELRIGLSATAIRYRFLFQCRAKINHPRHHVTTKHEMSRV